MTKDLSETHDSRTPKAMWFEVFRGELERAGLPKADVDDALSFYSEVVDDHIDEGMSEEEALATLGDVKKVTRSILDEIPPAERMETRFIASTAVQKAVIITLLVLGFPLWGSLFAAAGCVFLSLLAALFAVATSVWLLDGALFLSGVAGVVLLFEGIATSVPWTGLFAFGCGIVAAGVAVLVTPFMATTSVWAIRVMVALARKAVSPFSRQFRKAKDMPDVRLHLHYPKSLLFIGLVLVAIGGVSTLAALVACGFDPTTLPPISSGPFVFDV